MNYTLTSKDPVVATAILTKRELKIAEGLLGNMAERHGDRLVTLEAEIVYRGPRRRAVLLLSEEGKAFVIGRLWEKITESPRFGYARSDAPIHERLLNRITRNDKLHPLERLAKGTLK